MKPRLFIISLLCPFLLNAQDLTGTWEGGGTGAFSTRYAKLVIIKCGDKYVGYTYDSGPGFCEAHFSGTFDPATGNLKGVNEGMIRKSFDHTQSKYNLQYERKGGGVHVLEGSVHAKSAGGAIISFGIGGRVQYKRISREADTTDFMRRCLNDPALLPADTLNPDNPFVSQGPATLPEVSMSKIDSAIYATIKARRQNDTITTIYTNQPMISISLFDNGQVDGDTVTVLHNNSVVSSRLGVSARPYRFNISIDAQHPRHEVVLIAHNLGSIPPNTAKLIIEAGEQTYQLTASTDLSKNSVIVFKYKE
jgi:hypothetical protein